MHSISTLTIGPLTVISAAAISMSGATGGHGPKVGTILCLSCRCLYQRKNYFDVAVIRSCSNQIGY